MSHRNLPRGPLGRRLRVCTPVGALIGALYFLAALFLHAFPLRAARRAGWEPTLADAALPLLGGVLMGVLVALLWPARARKVTALAAGLVAGLPFGLAIALSVTGWACFHTGELVIALVVSAVIGLPLGAFIYDYDRGEGRDRDPAV